MHQSQGVRYETKDCGRGAPVRDCRWWKARCSEEWGLTQRNSHSFLPTCQRFHKYLFAVATFDMSRGGRGGFGRGGGACSRRNDRIQ
jgi:hypothetical protein